MVGLGLFFLRKWALLDVAFVITTPPIENTD
jgi:hypothetical protein